MNQKEFPEAIEMEKQLLSAMFMKEGLVVPEVASIIDADDLYRPEHRIVFQATKGSLLIILPLRKNFAKAATSARLTIFTCSILSTRPLPLLAPSTTPTSSRKRLISENLSNSANLSSTKLNAVSNRLTRFHSSPNNTLTTLPVPPLLQKKLPSPTFLPTISILLSNR